MAPQHEAKILPQGPAWNSASGYSTVPGTPEVESRKYETKYFLDGRDKEMERLWFQHAIVAEKMGKLVLAPINFQKEKGLKILDSATADGYWIQDLRSQCPNSHHTYVGTDIASQYFPPPTSLPPDVTFHTQSITKAWPEEWNESFDFVHQRFAMPSASADGIPAAVARLAGLLKSSGWMQCIETDHSIFTGPAMGDMWTVVQAVFKAIGLRNDVAKHLAGWLTETGLRDVEERVFDVPLGAKNSDAELARKGTIMMMRGASGLVDAAKQMPTGLDHAWLDTIVPNIEKELNSSGGVLRIHVSWGRKAMLML